MSEQTPLRVLYQCDDRGASQDLAAFLATCARLDVEVGALPPRGHHVVVSLSDQPVSDVEAAALLAHLRAGGGVVAIGPTLGAWTRNALVADALHWMPGDLGPTTELRVRPVPGSGVSPRLDPEILLRDRVQLGPGPADGDPLLTVPWHFSQQVAAFRCRIGAGTLVYLGLGHAEHTLREPVFHRLVHRCVATAAGLQAGPSIGVGLYGYGAIGREHAAAVVDVEGLELRGVCDRAQERRLDAGRFDVPAHAEAHDLLADPSVELVVVGVPPSFHAEAVMDCLAAGKHVVCEKPFALRVEEADRMLAAADDAGRTLTVYQSRRWDPDFQALHSAVLGGAIGTPFYLESFIGGFSHPCSYWHSHEPISGGTIFDWGSHYFDWLLQLFPGQVVRVMATAQQRVWHDVSNADQVRVDLTFEGGEQAMFLQSDVAAAVKPKWYLLGTSGAILGDWRRESVKTRSWTGDLVEEVLSPAESPARVRVHRADGYGGVSVEELGLQPRVRHGFYRNLADHLLLGESLAVPPEEARRTVAVMEAAARSIARGGCPVDIRA